MFASNLFPKSSEKEKVINVVKFLISWECGEEYMGTRLSSKLVCQPTTIPANGARVGSPSIICVLVQTVLADEKLFLTLDGVLFKYFHHQLKH